MKIAVLIDRIYPFYLGGYETSMYNLLTRLGPNCQIDIYTSTDEVLKISDRIRFIRITGKHKYTNSKGQHSLVGSMIYLLSAIRISRRLKGYDYVILEAIPYLGLGLVLNKIGGTRISYFQEAWYLYPPDYRRPLMRHAIKSILKNTDLVVAISESTESSLRINYGFERVITIPVGVDIQEIQAVQQADEMFDVSYMGRLGSIKNVRVIIYAIALLAEKGLRLKTIIIGDGEERKNLLKLAHKLGVTDIMTFTGRVSEERKFRYLKSSRIFVLPSEREGFSIATMEAMACGNVPIVAKPPFAEVFGVSHFVKDNYNGLYFPLNDSHNLAEKIEKLVRDPVLYNRLKDNSVKEAEKYDWSDIANAFREILTGTFKKEFIESDTFLQSSWKE